METRSSKKYKLDTPEDLAFQKSTLTKNSPPPISVSAPNTDNTSHSSDDAASSKNVRISQQKKSKKDKTFSNQQISDKKDDNLHSGGARPKTLNVKQIHNIPIPTSLDNMHSSNVQSQPTPKLQTPPQFNKHTPPPPIPSYPMSYYPPSNTIAQSRYIDPIARQSPHDSHSESHGHDRSRNKDQYIEKTANVIALPHNPNSPPEAKSHGRQHYVAHDVDPRYDSGYMQEMIISTGNEGQIKNHQQLVSQISQGSQLNVAPEGDSLHIGDQFHQNVGKTMFSRKYDQENVSGYTYESKHLNIPSHKHHTQREGTMSHGSFATHDENSNPLYVGTYGRKSNINIPSHKYHTQREGTMYHGSFATHDENSKPLYAGTYGRQSNIYIPSHEYHTQREGTMYHGSFATHDEHSNPLYAGTHGRKSNINIPSQEYHTQRENLPHGSYITHEDYPLYVDKYGRKSNIAKMSHITKQHVGQPREDIASHGRDLMGADEYERASTSANIVTFPHKKYRWQDGQAHDSFIDQERRQLPDDFLGSNVTGSQPSMASQQHTSHIPHERQFSIAHGGDLSLDDSRNYEGRQLFHDDTSVDYNVGMISQGHHPQQIGQIREGSLAKTPHEADQKLSVAHGSKSYFYNPDVACLSIIM